MLKIDSELLKTIADLHEIPSGAYNIRKNGSAMGRRSTEHIEIIPKAFIILAVKTAGTTEFIPFMSARAQR